MLEILKPIFIYLRLVKHQIVWRFGNIENLIYFGDFVYLVNLGYLGNLKRVGAATDLWYFADLGYLGDFGDRGHGEDLEYLADYADFKYLLDLWYLGCLEDLGEVSKLVEIVENLVTVEINGIQN